MNTKNYDPNIPYVDPKLVTYLETTFPTSVYNTLTSHEAFLLYQGNQQLVEHLKSLMASQEKHGNILNV